MPIPFGCTHADTTVAPRIYVIQSGIDHIASIDLAMQSKCSLTQVYFAAICAGTVTAWVLKAMLR
jgi:hypothetical protein